MEFISREIAASAPFTSVSPHMSSISDCVVLHGPELRPHHCKHFAWQGDTITRLDLGLPCNSLDAGALVVIPGLYNGHTHLGDSALPDGAAGLTLEEGFFRPHGYKYRELAKLDAATHQGHIEGALRYMAQTGTIAHLDFREQGPFGSQLLRDASTAVGVQSIILGQFQDSPFAAETLTTNTAALPPVTRAELAALLDIADGFSESTMNDLTDPAWLEIKATTAAAGKLRAIHCLENPAYREVSLARTGQGDLVRAIELLAPHIIVHLTEATDAEIALLAQSAITGVLNPRANTTLGLPVPPIMRLLDAGVNLLLGTDNVMLNPPNLFAELDFTWRLARSQVGESRAHEPDPLRILQMVTTNIARVLGGDAYGYLATGLPASFAVIDFHARHLRSTRNLSTSLVSRVGPGDVLATYREGRELWRDPDRAWA